MIYGLVGVALVAILAFFMRRPVAPRIVIKNPTLGVLDLASPSDSASAAGDVKVLAPYFSAVKQSVDVSPRCDVLLLYCEMDSGGALRGSRRRLREIIRDTGATVVVVATEHPVDTYIAGAAQSDFGQANPVMANLVMTLDRKGPVFSEFLGRLFAQMKRGVTMPVAWNKLAPQIPGVEHKDVPQTIFACERGPVAFG